MAVGVGCKVAVSVGDAAVDVGCKVAVPVGREVFPYLCSVSRNNERRVSVVVCKVGVTVGAVGTGVDVGVRLQAVSARKIVIVAVVNFFDCMGLGYQTDVLIKNRGRSKRECS